MPGKRQRADAYRGLTYLQLNTDKGTQQIIQGEGRGRIVSLTRKSSVKRKRPENACHVRRQHPALPCTLSRGSLERQSRSVGHRDRPSLAEALGRANCLFGAGQTPASWSLLSPFAFSPHAFLFTLFLSSRFSLLVLSSLCSPHAFLFSRFSLHAFSLQNVPLAHF